MNLSEHTAELLEVLQWPLVGPVKARAFLAATPSGASILETANRLGPAPSRTARELAKRQRDDIVERCEKLGIRLVSLADKKFPRL